MLEFDSLLDARNHCLWSGLLYGYSSSRPGYFAGTLEQLRPVCDCIYRAELLETA